MSLTSSRVLKLPKSEVCFTDKVDSYDISVDMVFFQKGEGHSASLKDF